MNLLELLHNEKVVKTLEKIDNDLKDIIEPGVNDNSIFLKIIMIIETLLKKKQNIQILTLEITLRDIGILKIELMNQKKN